MDGVLDDDQQHFEKQILKLPEVMKAKDRAETKRKAANAGHEAYNAAFRGHYPGDFTLPDIREEAERRMLELKNLCKAALQAQWDFFDAFAHGADTAIGKIAVLLTTTDVALKLYAGLANAFMPAARLLKKQQAHALLMDEVQRGPGRDLHGAGDARADRLRLWGQIPEVPCTARTKLLHERPDPDQVRGFRRLGPPLRDRPPAEGLPGAGAGPKRYVSPMFRG